ncbi:hypothetical protein ACFQYP_23740 [Nonomuraea antimicrobica]
MVGKYLNSVGFDTPAAAAISVTGTSSKPRSRKSLMAAVERASCTRCRCSSRSPVMSTA